MKKLLLLLAATTMALGATATTGKHVLQTKINLNSEKVLSARQAVKLDSKLEANPLRAKSVVTPEGTSADYGFSSYNFKYKKVEARFSEDGTKVYFDNMFPDTYENGEAWVQGNISTDGTSVVFPADLYIGELTDYNTGETFSVAPIEILVDAALNVTGYQELVFVKEGDKIYIDDDLSNPSRYIGLGAFKADGAFDGLFDYDRAIAYEPYDESKVPALVQLPEGAEPAEFIYTSYDEDTIQYKEKKLVYVDGNDVYMSGLCVGLDTDAWVKGTKDGNTVTFPSGQYVGQIDLSFFGVYDLYFTGCSTDGSVDDDGYPLYNILDSYTLTYDPETNVYTNSDLSVFTSAITDDYMLWYTRSGFVIEPYAGAVPAVPADPYNLAIEDYVEDFGQYRFTYVLPVEDVNGNFIDPECLSYYIYVDGEIYTLTPELFIYQTEPELTLLPYDYSDGYDVSPGSIYMSELLFTTYGIQSVYTVDGETNYSNVVSVDLEGNVTVEPAPQNLVGIDNVSVKQISSVGIYDAEGRKLDAPQKGVNIVKMVAADGSVKVVKMYKK